MQLFFNLKSFHIYNLILIILFCILVNPNNDLYIIYYSLYSVFHFLIIYLSVYHYKNILYPIYFFYGLGIDLLWFNEIGPHLLNFLFVLFFINLFRKYLYNLNSFKTYSVLLVILLLMILNESMISSILFDFDLKFIFMIQILVLSIILSFPIFIIFSKIDRIK